MPPQPRILIIPDLPILIYDRRRYQHDLQGLRQQYLTLIDHIDAYEQHRMTYPELQVCITTDLRQSLMTEFPWDQSEQEPIAAELTDLFTAVLPWLNSAVEREIIEAAEIVTVRDATQDCYFAHQKTRQDWRNLINSSENCWRGPDSSEYLKVISSVAELRRVQRNGRDVFLVEVFPPAEWSLMLKWAVDALPRIGDYSYLPHRSWNGRKTFPRGGSGVNAGPRDQQDYLWTWDHRHGGTHWHIIDDHGKRWFEITPDGRILNQYKG
jgi:hypothetical protein